MNRVNIETAYHQSQPFYRALAFAATTSDPIERLLRWARLTKASEQATGLSRDVLYPYLFPDRSNDPTWCDQDVLSWFLSRAAALGIKPEPTYRTWVARSRLFRGEERVAGPLRAAWRLLSQPDTYLLTDGSLMLDNDYVQGERPARLNLPGLVVLAEILDL